jgi:hypothetical protein
MDMITAGDHIRIEQHQGLLNSMMNAIDVSRTKPSAYALFWMAMTSGIAFGAQQDLRITSGGLRRCRNIRKPAAEQ